MRYISIHRVSWIRDLLVNPLADSADPDTDRFLIDAAAVSPLIRALRAAFYDGGTNIVSAGLYAALASFRFN